MGGKRVSDPAQRGRRWGRRHTLTVVICANLLISAAAAFFAVTYAQHATGTAQAQERQIQAQQQRQHDGLCQLVTAATMPRLARPDKTRTQAPTSWAAYEWNQRFITASREFNCK
jgi:hypothetical protein